MLLLLSWGALLQVARLVVTPVTIIVVDVGMCLGRRRATESLADEAVHLVLFIANHNRAVPPHIFVAVTHDTPS